MISYKSKLYIFGGCDGKREYGDLYKIKLSNLSVQKMESRGDVPSPRYGHVAVLYKDFMYVMGGWDGQRCLNDFYQYSFSEYLFKFWTLLIGKCSSSYLQWSISNISSIQFLVLREARHVCDPTFLYPFP